MILGARFLRFLISFGGLSVCLLAVVGWMLMRPRSRRPRLALLALAVAYAVLGCYPLAEKGARWLAAPFHQMTEREVPAGHLAIVLLGSGSYTFTSWNGQSYSTLDREGVARTFEAARLFDLTPAAWIISSGGKTDPGDPNLPSGVAMRDTLMRMGVPKDRILVDQQSRTTREQAVIVAAMLKTLPVDRVVLVTSGFHMRRSLAVFRSAGIPVIPAIARPQRQRPGGIRALIPSAAGLNLSHRVLHELVGLVYYRLRGWQH